MENVNGTEKGIKKMYDMAYDLMIEAYENHDNNLANILYRLRGVLGDVVTHSKWIERSLVQVDQGSFNSLGVLQGTAIQYDIAVAKCAELLNLLPDEIRKRIENAARS